MIAWRNLLRNKGYSFINIGGLATGMTVAMLIGLWMYDELSFNKQFDNHNRIAQVMQNQTFDGEVETWYGQAMQLAPELRSSYGKHFKYIVRSSYPRSLILSTGEKHLTKTGNYMEPQAPDMLTLTMLKGTRQGLNDPSSILLSSSVARALFGDKDPMNQVLKINNKLNVKSNGCV
jgi:hypothetical protein